MLQTIKAIKDIQRIRKGGTAFLSRSQIVNINFNIAKAKENLSTEQFYDFQQLFNHYKSDNQKEEMNLTKYMMVCQELIDNFEKIAPYDTLLGR